MNEQTGSSDVDSPTDIQATSANRDGVWTSGLVSILIVSWNTVDSTLSCLDSLSSGVDDELKTEVIVVDNGSQDGSSERLAARDDVILLSNETNRGFAAAVNQAFLRASGDLVLLLNSDVELFGGSLSMLARFLRDRPGVAGVAPIYLNPDGSLQQHHFRLPTLWTVLADSSAIVRRIPPFRERLRTYRIDEGGIDTPQQVPQPSASCLLIRRDVLPPDHIFDERYPIFFNDVQLARELSSQGHELWVTPHVRVTHEGHASTRLLGPALRRQYVGSLVRFLQDAHPAYVVWVYRSFTFVGGLASYALGRPYAIPPRELVRALAGDLGSLPDAPRNSD